VVRALPAGNWARKSRRDADAEHGDDQDDDDIRSAAQISARDVEVERRSADRSREYGISPETCDSIAQEIKELQELDVQLAVVIGGGNIFRGLAGTKHAWTAPPAITWACSPP